MRIPGIAAHPSHKLAGKVENSFKRVHLSLWSALCARHLFPYPPAIAIYPKVQCSCSPYPLIYPIIFVLVFLPISVSDPCFLLHTCVSYASLSTNVFYSTDQPCHVIKPLVNINTLLYLSRVSLFSRGKRNCSSATRPNSSESIGLQTAYGIKQHLKTLSKLVIRSSRTRVCVLVTSRRASA
ncbi:hypothetical protein KEM48_001648 [Puccinia striiformis f. sp. tritici PST-130]|nr:hypothetical protein KEM48_001648 [Puccinia striiformis f. sp. tritici PST-130]